MTDFSPADIPLRDPVDVSAYPEDVRDTVAAVCELWMLKPPSNKKDKAYWIESSRRVAEACGQWQPRLVLRAIFADWNTKLHQGKAYTVEGPGSLVKEARAHAGLMRRSGVVDTWPSEEKAWEAVRDAIVVGHWKVEQVLERAVNATGGWEYLSELGVERAHFAFAGKYREMRAKAAVGQLTKQLTKER